MSAQGFSRHIPEACMVAETGGGTGAFRGEVYASSEVGCEEEGTGIGMEI